MTTDTATGANNIRTTQRDTSKRVSSLSRGFGISVIDTTTNVQHTSKPTSIDADSSIISQSSIISGVADENVPPDHSYTSTITSNLTDSGFEDVPPDIQGQIDVSLSTSTLRHPSFNNSKQFFSPNPNNVNMNKKQVASHRFRSTPSLPNSFSPPNVPVPLPQSNSNSSSPYLAQHARHLYQQKSATTIKLPRRRSTQQLTKKQKAKIYDDDNDDIVDDIDHDVFMYNVPIASASSLRMFQHANENQSKDALRKAWNESESNLIIPPSPLPGKLADNRESQISTLSLTTTKITAANTPDLTPQTPIGQSFQSPTLWKNKSFGVLSPTAQQLSTFYEFTSHNQAEDELMKRKQQSTPSTNDPQLMITLDDLSIASHEKLSKLTVTRPSWIPPKDRTELHDHEKQFKKLLENTSKQALKQSKHQIKIEHDRVIGDARLKHLSQKSQLSSNNCQEIRKFILVTDIDNLTKFTLFRKMLLHKLGPNTLLSPPFQKQENTIVTEMPDLEIEPLFKDSNLKLSEVEISSLRTVLQPVTRPVPSNSIDVNKLPKIPALPIQTLLYGFTKISLILLRSNYTTSQVRDIIYWLHAHIFTVKFKKRFTKLLSTSSVTKLFKEFKDDYSILTVPTGLDLVLDLPDKVVCKCIELLIVFWCLGGGRGVKMFTAMIICIIRDYHFGWNNLQVIFHSKAHIHIGNNREDTEKFFTRLLSHYGLIG